VEYSLSISTKIRIVPYKDKVKAKKVFFRIVARTDWLWYLTREMIDLHIHTIASSDGQHTPIEIFQMARDLKIWALAFADHNSVESVAEGKKLAQDFGMVFLACLELDTVYKDRDLHLLGYLLDYKANECGAWMKEIFHAKMEQTKKRVDRLKELGFAIEFEELMNHSEGRLPTGNSYVRALAGRPENKGDPRVRAFIDGDRSDSPYLNFYLEAQPTTGAIEKLKKLGGIPILAHPSDTPEGYIHELVDAGMMGLEVYSSYHDTEMTENFMRICKDRNLLVTAGSDFHGKKIKPAVTLGVELDMEHEIVDDLFKAKEQMV
jgi:predicted metal-dependent phosphoesterase TrpH